MTIPKDYIERLYAAWYGKLIGVRYGAPIEGWSYDSIQRIYGELDGYVVDYKDFAADDDSNGPIFFIRALEDYGLHATAEEIGLTWLNYAQEGKGFFWWGGYGVSTEHTAYLNLKNGISAPRSGSIAQNGAAVAEQIGGQIFIDSWGLVAPGNLTWTAEFAQKAASVSHDGAGIHGGIFTAVAISAAFVKSSIYEVIDTALCFIPQDTEYMAMARDVRDFWMSHPENWRECFQFVYDHYGYDRYPGACHMIPNAAVMLLSMLYGEGDFDKTLNICNMCGWDTDCNVGNVGTIMGALVGLQGINYDKWRKPINDFFAASSAIGSLNILDVPFCVRYIAKLAYQLAAEAPPEQWKAFVDGTAAKFGFDLPGATHGFRVRHTSVNCLEYALRQTAETSYEGNGCLSFHIHRMNAGDAVYLHHKTFYHPSDFHDSRYDPAFSPTLYPGETVSCFIKTPENLSGKVSACMYVRDEYENRGIRGETIRLTDEWIRLELDIPAGSALIGEAGLVLQTTPAEGWAGTVHVYVDSFDFNGKSDFTVDFSKENIERWHGSHQEIGQLTTIRGIFGLSDGMLDIRCADYAEGYAGRYDLKDYRLKAVFTPCLGDFHQVNFRVQGVIRSYAVALLAGNKLALLKNFNGYRELAAVNFPWEHGKEYTISIKVTGSQIEVSEGDNLLFTFTDNDKPYLKGQVGMSVRAGSHTRYRTLNIKEF